MVQIWCSSPSFMSSQSFSQLVTVHLGNFFFIFWFTDLPTFFFFFKLEKRNYFRLFIFILSSDATILSSLILKQGVQGLQVFAFCILAVIDEHMKQS